MRKKVVSGLGPGGDAAGMQQLRSDPGRGTAKVHGGEPAGPD